MWLVIQRTDREMAARGVWMEMIIAAVQDAKRSGVLVFCHRHSNPIVRNIYRRAVKHEVNMAERATH
jgi:hypothetical protein